MVFELRGVEFHNKGAELMMQAIVQKIRTVYPDAKFVMAKKYGASMKQIWQADFFVKLNFKRFGLDTERIGKFIPAMLRHKLGFMLEKEVDVILEGSGFAFGDFFGHEKAAFKLTNHLQRWENLGIKVILLPQAFGPFTNQHLRERMQDIISNVDLIFARDTYSYNYLREIDEQASNIFLKPDFTNLVQGKTYSQIPSENDLVAIIPNNKLLESGVFTKRDDYLNVLGLMVKEIKRTGMTPVFLIHEGEKDLLLAKDVNDRFGLSTDIIKEDDPLIVKGIIGQVKGLVTSRFHGLVSGLAQGIPSLCIGWSHKYTALLEDYNHIDGLINDSDLKSESKLKQKLVSILDETSRSEIEAKLRESSKVQKANSEEMWKRVFDVIDSKI